MNKIKIKKEIVFAKLHFQWGLFHRIVADSMLVSSFLCQSLN